MSSWADSHPSGRPPGTGGGPFSASFEHGALRGSGSTSDPGNITNNLITLTGTHTPVINS